MRQRSSWECRCSGKWVPGWIVAMLCVLSTVRCHGEVVVSWPPCWGLTATGDGDGTREGRRDRADTLTGAARGRPRGSTHQRLAVMAMAIPRGLIADADECNAYNAFLSTVLRV